MAIIVLILIGAFALVAVIVTLVQVARDGYRPVPTQPDRLRHP
jgi:hypothetical protein